MTANNNLKKATLSIILIGIGLGGFIDHQLLGIHHVKYNPDTAWNHPSLVWDIGFLLIGGIGFILLGWVMSRLETQEVVRD